MERGPLRAMDRISHLTEPDSSGDLTATSKVVVVPHQSSYPLQFLGTATTGTGRDAIVDVWGFSRRSAKDPWQATFQISLGKGPAPRFAVNSDGFAQTISPVQWKSLMAMPDALPALWSTAYEQAAGAARGAEPKSRFAPSRNVRTYLHRNQAEKASYGANQVRRSISAQPLSLPIGRIVYQLADHRAFVGFATADRVMLSAKARARSLRVAGAKPREVGRTQPKSGNYRSVTYRRYAIWGAIVPLASGADHDIDLIGIYSGTVGVNTTRASRGA